MKEKFTGTGFCVFPDGAEYTGEFKNGLPDGIGSLVLPSFDTYEGQWEEGEMSGFGVYRFYNSKLDKLKGYYEGGFLHSKFNGQGKMVYPNSSVFYGQWRDGHKEGLGEYVSYSGIRIIGNWHDDFITEGIYEFTDGSKYIGHFKDSKFDGFGSLIYVDGSIQQGLWKDNVLIEGLSYTTNNEINAVVNNQILLNNDEV